MKKILIAALLFIATQARAGTVIGPQDLPQNLAISSGVTTGSGTFTLTGNGNFSVIASSGVSAGNVQLTAGGFLKFPDGTSMTTASSGGGASVTSTNTWTASQIFSSSVTVANTVFSSTASVTNGLYINGWTVVASISISGNANWAFYGMKKGPLYRVVGDWVQNTSAATYTLIENGVTSGYYARTDCSGAVSHSDTNASSIQLTGTQVGATFPYHIDFALKNPSTDGRIMMGGTGHAYFSPSPFENCLLGGGGGADNITGITLTASAGTMTGTIYLLQLGTPNE